MRDLITSCIGFTTQCDCLVIQKGNTGTLITFESMPEVENNGTIVPFLNELKSDFSK